MVDEEFVLYLKWKDNKSEIFDVGYLAQIQNQFYFMIDKKEDSKINANGNNAFEKGFITIPGFKLGKIYVSPEVFDFFKYRMSNDKSKTVYERLIDKNNLSNIDSFYLEPVQEGEAEEEKKKLLKKYKEQIDAEKDVER